MRQNQKKKWKQRVQAGCLCLLVCLAAIWMNVTARADTKEDRSLSMEVLWNEKATARAGRNVPFEVRLTWENTDADQDGEETIEGTVSAKVMLQSQEYYTIEEPVTVSRGETSQVIFQIPITYGTGALQFSFTKGDEVLKREEITLSHTYHQTDLNMGILTETPSDFDWCANVVLEEYYDIETSVTFLQNDKISENMTDLSAYDFLLLDQVSRDDLEETQWKAIEAWVENGGILIAGGDSEPAIQTATAGEEEFQRELLGNGVIVSCSFSLSSLKDREMDSTEIGTFLKQCIGEKRWDELVNQIIYGLDLYWEAEEITPVADADRIPTVGVYGVTLMLYLVILGPILYLILKRNKQQPLMRLAMVATAVCFTCLIYILGSKTRYTTPFVSYVSVLDLSKEETTEEIYLNMQSPHHSSYSIQLSGDYDLTYLSDTSQETKDRDWSDMTERAKMSRTEEGMTVEMNDTIPFTSEYLYLKKTEEAADNRGLTGTLTIMGESIGGTLSNHTGMALTHVSIWCGNQWIYVGDMAEEETVSLQDARTEVSVFSCHNALYQKTTGSDQYTSAVESKEAEIAYWRNRYLQNELLYADISAEKALVYAFPAEESLEIVTGGTDSIQGISVLKTEIDASFTQGNLTYHPDMSQQITVEEGYCDADFQTIYENQAILRYSFGEEKLETLYLQWPEEEDMADYTKMFSGTMAFYNVETHEFEEVEAKTSYEAGELAPYLSQDNSLLVRWKEEDGDTSSVEIQLPLFTYIGRKTS